MATQINVKLEATIVVPKNQSQSVPKTDCSGCGKCSKSESPNLNQAGEALLNLAGGAYTLDQLGTALGIIEALLKQHYGVESKK